MVNATKHRQYVIENDDDTNNSHRHYIEILKQSRPTEASILPDPKGLFERLIYWIHHERRRAKPSGYWRYVIDVYKNLFLTFYFNWTMVFTAPLSSIAFILVYPTAGFLLFAFEIGLKVFMDYLGGAKIMKRWSETYANGFGIINWGAPYMLLSPQTAELVKSVLPSLAEPAIDLDHNKTDGRQRTFDISIAQAMTALSALVYERHDAKVTEAYKMLLRNPKDDQLVADAKRLIWESERPIRQIAKTFNLHFSGITELKSLGGPFCGIYWSDSHPFIIVTFKGTTPTNYSEFLVDATFQRTDARGFLFGAVHQGFYDGLFPKGDEDERDPYFAIQSTILEKAEYLKQKLGTDKPIQVWIAGHSLGSALGGLLFARWLKSTEDISPTCELRDAYLIGCPALGDNNFASLFASYSNVPSTRTSTMWRIINKSDMICRLPPGYNSPTVGHYMPTTDFFNYSHVGHAVQITYPILHHYPLKSYPSNYQPNLHVDIIPGAWQGNSDYSNRKIINPITKLESFYPFFIRDHIPINYFKGLERARMHYMTKQKDDASQQNEMIKSLDI